MFRTFVVIASLAASTVAVASPTHLSDVQYIAAARCQALLASPALGKSDTHAIDALVRGEDRIRSIAVSNEAQTVAQDARTQARHATPMQKTELVAERDGVCQAYNGAPTMTAGAAATPSNAN